MDNIWGLSSAPYILSLADQSQRFQLESDTADWGRGGTRSRVGKQEESSKMSGKMSTTGSCPRSTLLYCSLLTILLKSVAVEILVWGVHVSLGANTAQDKLWFKFSPSDNMQVALAGDLATHCKLLSLGFSSKLAFHWRSWAAIYRWKWEKKQMLDMDCSTLWKHWQKLGKNQSLAPLLHFTPSVA